MTTKPLYVSAPNSVYAAQLQHAILQQTINLTYHDVWTEIIPSPSSSSSDNTPVKPIINDQFIGFMFRSDRLYIAADGWYYGFNDMVCKIT